MEEKDVRQGRVCSGVLCLERVRVVQGLRANHGTSPCRSEYDAKEKQKWGQTGRRSRLHFFFFAKWFHFLDHRLYRFIPRVTQSKDKTICKSRSNILS
jgi:hypothetical protein